MESLKSPPGFSDFQGVGDSPENPWGHDWVVIEGQDSF